MSFAHRLRLPASTRHAFALAFDLAARRDPLHSLVLPLLVRGPWAYALLLLFTPGTGGLPMESLVLKSLAGLGGAILFPAVDAMLRFRARSVFNTPAGTRPMPVLECYALGIRRLPWLYLTEFVRGSALAFAFTFFVLPGIFLGHRLSFSTEAVVLDDHNTASAFQHSFRLGAGRFERWFEMIVVSVLLVLATLFLATLIYVTVHVGSWATWKNIGTLMVVAILPVIQYAWTFFYLRLIEVEEPKGVEVGPLYAVTPLAPWAGAGPGGHLKLVEPAPQVTSGEERGA
jgi:hypothetical protein